MALECSVKVLSGVPSHKEAVVYFTEKKHVLRKLHSGMNYIVLLAAGSM